MADNNKREIPGFYRDPETGRFYRDNPGPSGNSSVKALQRKKKELPVPPKHTNVVNFLNNRSINAIGSVPEQRQYWEMRIFTKRGIQKELIKLNSARITAPEFIKGGETSVYGMWNCVVQQGTKLKQQYAIGETNFLNVSSQKLRMKTHSNYIIDMCEGPNDTIVAVYNNQNVMHAYAEFFPRRPPVIINSTQIFFSADIFEPSRRRIDRSALFCCSSTSTGTETTVGFGSESLVNLFKIEDSRTIVKTVPVENRRVHSLAFDSMGKVMTYGTNNGRLYVYDTTTDAMVHEFQIHDCCLIDAAFLNDYQVIIASVDDSLQMVS